MTVELGPVRSDVVAMVAVVQICPRSRGDDIMTLSAGIHDSISKTTDEILSYSENIMITLTVHSGWLNFIKHITNFFILCTLYHIHKLLNSHNSLL